MGQLLTCSTEEEIRTIKSEPPIIIDDNDLNAIIEPSMQTLNSLPDKSWQRAVSLLMKNPLLEPMDDFMDSMCLRMKI